MSESVDIRTRIVVDPRASEPGIRAVTAQVRLLTRQIEALGTGVSQSMAANMRAMSREVRTLRRQMGVGARAWAQEQRNFARQVEADMRAVHARVEAMGQRVETRGAQISRVLHFGAALYVLERMALVSRRVVGAMLHIQTSMQNAEISIAGMFAAMSNSTVPEVMGMARDVIRELRVDAAAGAGEIQDYVDAYQRLLGPVLAVGGSLEDVREITRLAMGTGFAMRGREGMQLAALDILQGLQGGLSPAESQILAPLLGMSGKSLETLNKARGHEKMVIILDALRQMAPAVDAMGDTWDAQMASLQDQVKELILIATSPIFERWTDHLRNANDWLAQNRDTVREMAEVWGRRLLETWDELIDRGPELGRALAAAGVAGGVAQIGSSTGAWSALAAGVRGRVAAMPGLGGGATAAGTGGAAGGFAVAAMLAGIAFSAAAANEVLEEQPEHWLVLEQRLNDVTVAGQQFKSTVLDSWAGMFADGGLGAAWGERLLEGADAALWFVEQLIYAADWITWAFNKAGEWFGVLQSFAAVERGWVLDGLNMFLGRNEERRPGETFGEQLQRLRRERATERWAAFTEDFWRFFGHQPFDESRLGESMLDPELDDPFGTSPYDPVLDRRDPPKAPQTNIGHITINIHVREAQDPQRMALVVDDVLTNVERYRAQARRVLRPR